MTILEAHVSSENWAALELAYKSEIQHLPPQLTQTFLIQDTIDRTLWQIITLWRSREDLEEMRRLGTPAGVLMFRTAGAEPTLSVFEVVADAVGQPVTGRFVTW